MSKIHPIAIHPIAALFMALAAVGSVHATDLSPNYRIELSKDTGGLDIAVRTFAGGAITLGLENRSDKAVHCSAGFNDIPQNPGLGETRHATIKPGGQARLGYPARAFGEFSTAYVNLKFVESGAERKKQ